VIQSSSRRSLYSEINDIAYLYVYCIYVEAHTNTFKLAKRKEFSRVYTNTKGTMTK